MTNQQQAVMQRILDMKICPTTNTLLNDVSFGIYKEIIEEEVFYCLYRSVRGQRDKHALVKSTSIKEVYVYYGPLQP